MPRRRRLWRVCSSSRKPPLPTLYFCNTLSRFQPSCSRHLLRNGALSACRAVIVRGKDGSSDALAKAAVNIMFNLSAEREAHALFPSCITGCPTVTRHSAPYVIMPTGLCAVLSRVGSNLAAVAAATAANFLSHAPNAGNVIVTIGARCHHTPHASCHINRYTRGRACCKSVHDRRPGSPI